MKLNTTNARILARHATLLVILPFALLMLTALGVAAPESAPAEQKQKSRVTLQEARGQSKLLHETFHVTLQVVHQQYFRQGEKVQIPSRTLDTVFEELSRERDIEFRWISVNAEAMNINHEPRDAFEKKAAKAIATGKDSYEQVEKGVYRRAGRIALLNQCLKCHLPNRTSTKTRSAALIINMRLKE